VKGQSRISRCYSFTKAAASVLGRLSSAPLVYSRR